MKNRQHKQRRNFLKTLLAAGISPALYGASPLVGSLMLSRTAEAAGTNPIDKSFVVLSCGGSLDQYWRPSSGLVLPEMSAPYEAVKNEMNFICGGSMSAAGHGQNAHRFNDGSYSKESFDVNFGQTVGQNSPVKFLNLGVYGAGRPLSRQKRSIVPMIDDPQAAINLAFGNSGSGNTDENKTNIALVDAHKTAVDALSRKLGQHEKHKLDSHLNSISEFEKRFVNTSGNTTSCPNVPAALHDGTFKQFATVQSEIAILALKCGITKSISLSLGNDSHNFPLIPGIVESHKSHHDSNTQTYIDDVVYMSEVNAGIIARLKQEGLLESTIYTQLTDMGDARGHGNSNINLFMAGAGIKKGVVTTVNSSVTQGSMFQTVAQITGADQYENFRSWNKPVLSEVIA